MWYTYVLLSKLDNKYYIGSTKDLKKRFSQHNDGDVFSTRSRAPFVLVYYEACLSKYDMRAREKYLKSGMGHKYLNNRLRKSLFISNGVE